MKHVYRILLVLSILLLLASCSSALDTLHTGDYLDREALDSILAAFETTAPPPKTTKTPETVKIPVPEDGKYYWTENGMVWHTLRECSYLNASKSVIEGTLEEAMTAGKERACSRCCQ